MPRGFLIKRKKHQAYSWRHYIHFNSEDDQSECGSSSDPDANQQSPEPGLSDKIEREVDDSSQTTGESAHKRHFSKEWLLRRNSELKVDERPSSVESSDTENKNTLAPEQDANGNSISSKGTPEVDPLLKEVERVHEYNNNNNNREPLALYNKNFNLNHYGLYHPTEGAMPESPTGRANGLSINTSLYGSPFYWTFNRLALSSPQQQATRSALSSPVSVSSLSSRRDSIHSISPKSTPSPGKRKANQTPDNTKVKVMKRPKSARKISFEEELKSSPVSGTYIKADLNVDMEEDGIRVVSGDIDSSMNCVEITPEAEAELAKIDNKIGDFICKLCKELFDNAFTLAQHRCSRIVHVEYKCPECDKVFNCPANLASHRRWHKPRPPSTNNNNTTKANKNSEDREGGRIKEDSNRNANGSMPLVNDEGLFSCEECGKKFRRQAYLKKHQASHSSSEQPPTTSYPCFYCSKPFKSENSRSKHMLQNHTPADTKGPSCRLCGTVFPETLSLEQHMRCHHGSTSGLPTAEPFSCKCCPSSFFSMYGLSRHMYKCHPLETRQAMAVQLPPVTHQPQTRPC